MAEAQNTDVRPITSDPKRVLYVADALFACAWYRCHVPGIELMRYGHEVELRDRPGHMAGEDAQVFISQASLGPAALAEVNRLNTRGALTIYDMDDDPWTLQPDNPAHDYWHDPGTQERLGAMLRSVKMITTTTPELAERLGRFNSNVVVLPNMLPSEFWPAERRPVRDTDNLVIGWAGGNAHRPDIREIDDVLFQILDRYPNVELHLCGAQEDWLSRMHPRIVLVETVPISEYASVLEGFDIALAPLADNRFNAGKSDLKFLEYAMMGLPVVASKMPSYARSIRHGETGFVAASHKDWLQRLRLLIEDAGLRDRVGANARAWAESRTIEHNIGRWKKAYGIAD